VYKRQVGGRFFNPSTTVDKPFSCASACVFRRSEGGCCETPLIKFGIEAETRDILNYSPTCSVDYTGHRVVIKDVIIVDVTVRVLEFDKCNQLIPLLECV